MRRNAGELRHSPFSRGRQQEPRIMSAKSSRDRSSTSYTFMVNYFNNGGQSINVGTVGKEDYATNFDLPPL